MNEVKVSHPHIPHARRSRSSVDAFDKKNTFGLGGTPCRYGVDICHGVGDFRTRHVTLWRTIIIDFVRVCWGVLHYRTKTRESAERGRRGEKDQNGDENAEINNVAAHIVLRRRIIEIRELRPTSVKIFYYYYLLYTHTLHAVSRPENTARSYGRRLVCAAAAAAATVVRARGQRTVSNVPLLTSNAAADINS